MNFAGFDIFGTQQILFVRMLYDNVEIDDLMTDDEVRIGCFGSDASNEEVTSRIL